MILGLDSGFSAKNATGVALLNPAIQRIVAAGVVRRNPDLNGLEAMRDIARQVWDFVSLHSLQGLHGLDAMVAEWPQVYQGERKDPNTALLPLAGIAGAVAGVLPRHVKLVQYLPREWKGTVDGDQFTERILARLDERERALIDRITPAGLRHNATDAAGMLLKYVGRLERARVVHNEASV